MKLKRLLKTETNRTAYNRAARQLLKCSICKPHQNENAGPHKKHGVRKPRTK